MDGAFVHVPILVGTNSDEGTSFSPKGVNDSEIFKKNVQGTAPLLRTNLILLMTTQFLPH
jgi:hypothetical protein